MLQSWQKIEARAPVSAGEIVGFREMQPGFPFWKSRLLQLCRMEDPVKKELDHEKNLKCRSRYGWDRPFRG